MKRRRHWLFSRTSQQSIGDVPFHTVVVAVRDAALDGIVQEVYVGIVPPLSVSAAVYHAVVDVVWAVIVVPVPQLSVAVVVRHVALEAVWGVSVDLALPLSVVIAVLRVAEAIIASLEYAGVRELPMRTVSAAYMSKRGTLHLLSTRGQCAAFDTGERSHGFKNKLHIFTGVSHGLLKCICLLNDFWHRCLHSWKREKRYVCLLSIAMDI